MVMSGPDQREDRWWRRSAISSLPVPRSPITRTGRFNGAARLARSTESRKARLDPTNWFVRSMCGQLVFLTTLWQDVSSQIVAENGDFLIVPTFSQCWHETCIFY